MALRASSVSAVELGVVFAVWLSVSGVVRGVAGVRVRSGVVLSVVCSAVGIISSSSSDTSTTLPLFFSITFII